MSDMDSLMAIYRRNFPYNIREASAVRAILSDRDNTVLEKRMDGAMVGVCVIRENTVYLLCVDREYRGRGIGSALLAEAESHVREGGYGVIVIGKGKSYLTPGVPTNLPPVDGLETAGSLPSEPDHRAAEFFSKRGYRHAYANCNIFDMIADLREAMPSGIDPGQPIDGIVYRWAERSDMADVLRCVEDAHESFCRYYRADALYTDSGESRVLIAGAGREICGALIVNFGEISPGIGSVGCTAVRHDSRGRGIATRMVIAGTDALRERDLEKSFIGYTYTGLDRLYGKAGYRICTYYMMAEKKL